MRLFHLLLALACLLAGCGLPDRWNVGYSRQPASGPLPARDIYSVGISGPLFLGGTTKPTPSAEASPTPNR